MDRKPKLAGMRAFGTIAMGVFVASALGACGGGALIGPGGGPGPGPVGTCASIAGAASGFALGTCSTVTAAWGTVLESSRKPIDAIVTIAPGATSYAVGLGALGAETLGNPTDLSLDGSGNLLNTLGAVRGLYLQKDYAAGAYAAIGDFSDARDRTTGVSSWSSGQPLSYTNFGLWERFVSASEGYYGGWYVPRTVGDANPALPVAGSATYSAVVVGALAPAQGNPPLYGLSASLSLTANFATNAVTGTMSGFWLSNQLLGVGAANIADVSLSGLILRSGGSGSFSGTMAGGASSGAFQGAFFGAEPAGRTGPAEVGGRFYFLTPDSRQVVGAFGGRQ